MINLHATWYHPEHIASRPFAPTVCQALHLDTDGVCRTDERFTSLGAAMSALDPFQGSTFKLSTVAYLVANEVRS